MRREILIVDDDALLRRSLAFHLEQAGYSPLTAANAEDALALAHRQAPDLVLLDIGLPGMDGLDALHQFKALGDIPIIYLTARRRGLDQVVGLELGADDYITKPFDVDVLLARLKAVLRRAGSTNESQPRPEPLAVGDLLIDPAAHTVTLQDQPVELSPREFDLLHALAIHPGVVVSTGDLLAQVWGAEFVGQPQVVYVHIRWLRQKLEEVPERPRRILTVHGIGYKLMPIEKKKE
jgi:DNA-binding response OmpR family regulator